MILSANYSKARLSQVLYNCWKSGGRNAMNRERRKDGVNPTESMNFHSKLLPFPTFTVLKLSDRLLSDFNVCYLPVLRSFFLFAEHQVVLVKAGSSLSCSVGKVKNTERAGIACGLIARTGK